jgi:subtilase family serine protease
MTLTSDTLIWLLLSAAVVIAAFLVVSGYVVAAIAVVAMAVVVALVAHLANTTVEPMAVASTTKPTVIASTEVKSFAYLATETNPYTPQQVASVYAGTVPYNGSGQKVGIITCYNHPNLQRDLDTFCRKYDLPTTQLIIHNRSSRQDRGWAIETCLDTQWCHVFAPNAEIHVFQAESATFSSLRRALQDAVDAKMNVVSMSLGASESTYASSAVNDIFAANPGIIFLAASGDDPVVSYPSSSNSVVSVGGTILSVEVDGNDNSGRPVEADYSLNTTRFKKVGETDWFLPDGSGTGHGISSYFTRPSYQDSHNASERRSTPDLSSIAATPSGGGVSVFCTTWLGVQGTSLSCPILAGMLATINAERIRLKKAPMNRATFLGFVYGQVPINIAIETSHDGAGFIGRRLIPQCVSA